MLFPKFLKIAIDATYETVKNSKGEFVKKTIYEPDSAMLTEILAQAVGFSYKLYVSKDEAYGRPLPDGNWTGLIGMVQRGEVDLAVSQIVITEERSNVVHFSYPFLIDSVTFATRKPEYSIDVAAILKPFSYDVWIAIAACLIILPVIFYFIEGKTRVFQNSVFYTFGTLLQQSCPQTFKHPSVLVFWLTSVMFLGYFYKAVLLSYLTFPSFTGVRTIPELSAAIAEGTYQGKSYQGSVLIDSFIRSENPDFQVIGLELQKNDAIRMHPLDFLQNTESLRKPAFVGLASDLISFKDSYFLSQGEFSSLTVGIAIRKEFCCKAQVDHIIGYIVAAGLFNKIIEDRGFKQSLKMLLDTSGKNLDANIIRKLSVSHLKLVFILLVTGDVLAFIVLLVEILFKKMSNNKALHASQRYKDKA